MDTLRSDKYPNIVWPRTCDTAIRASSSAPCVELIPLASAYEGMYSDGKKYPMPIAKFESE